MRNWKQTNLFQNDQFLVAALEEALEADAVASSHPLSFRVDKAAEVSEAFDSITYAKGGSVLTMLKALIGEENFKQAITMGYPVVTVETLNATTLKVTQNRYKKNKDAQEPEKYSNPKYGSALSLRFKWDVPLWYQEHDVKDVKRTWLPREQPLYLHVRNTDKPIVVNADRHGFYRQNYDSDGWKKIIGQFNKDHKVFTYTLFM
ncbi:hypothetical protein COOONC_15938 [Cooperia oncophora]